MRCILFSLLLLLATGSMTYGQAGPAFPFSLGQPAQSPPWTWQSGNFGSKFGPAQPNWDALRVLPRTVIEVPRPRRFLADPRIDPRMIVRPSPSRVGALPEGQLVARNLYPGLRFQPIHGPWCGPNPGPLATKWPRLKIEEIPTVWPRLRMEAVGSKDNSVP